MDEKHFSTTVKLQAMNDFGTLVIKLVDIFGEAEVAKMLRASARVVASGKAVK